MPRNWYFPSVRRGLLGRGLIGAIAAASLLVPASAAAVAYAPVDQPGKAD